jgi:hypothetical protein
MRNASLIPSNLPPFASNVKQRVAFRLANNRLMSEGFLFSLPDTREYTPGCGSRKLAPIPPNAKVELYSLVENGLSSSQRDSHAQAHFQRDPSRAHQALVAVARTDDLPPEAPARTAHPHST